MYLSDERGGNGVADNADTISAYYRRVAKQISRALEDKGMTQKHLARECEKRFGIEISQSTISKILNSDGGHMSMVFVSAICQILELSLTGLLSFQGGGPGESGDDTVFAPISNAEPGVRETLIRDPTDSVFSGYIDRTYDIFYWSTNSSENKLICGTMTLSNEENKFCRVHISLDTGKHPIKEYAGSMVISLLQQACYCTVESRRLGERCCFVFYHRFFSQGVLRVRLASVSTISVGDARRPIAHRMAICEKGAVDTEQKKAFVAAQLLMNSSQIIIPEERIEQLRQDETLCKLLDTLERPDRSKTFRIYDESEIRKLPNQDFRPMADAIAKLRGNSIAQRYNKIGGKADDFLYKYLFKYPAQEDPADD